MDLFKEEEIEDIGDGRSEISKSNACTNAMDQACHPRPSQKVHQTNGPRGMGKFQWQSGQDKADKGHHHRKVEHNVE